MNLNKISISNYKSIDNLDFEIKIYGDSYTTMLIGKNESGKSNILEAMSWLDIEENEEFDYGDIHNQKDDDQKPVQVDFYLSFDNDDDYLNWIKSIIKNWELLDFQIWEVKKSILIEEWNQEPEIRYDYKLTNLTKKLFIKARSDWFEINEEQDVIESYDVLNEEIFRKYLWEKVIEAIKFNLPKSSFWRPSEEYLLSTTDLNTFKENININIPLKHIFALSWYDNKDKITKAISWISVPHLRSKLMSKLSENLNEYIKAIWDHNIKIHIEITDSGKCNVNVQDDWKNNIHNFYPMSVRSEWFRQFMSLILSLSIEINKLWKRNSLILIDEPENHLHPSWIRDLREELLKIWKSNYLFVSTHSPFLVDTKNKERNIIIKKSADAQTEKMEIKEFDDIRDDEVLEEAFWINIYKDLLIPHRILVEWASDKIILMKALKMAPVNYWITNGNWSNIITLASKLNDESIWVLVVVDDDSDWVWYKNDIIKIGGIFTDENVFTLRDLVGWTIAKSTIEDFLWLEFVNAMFKKFYKENFSAETTDVLVSTKPFIEQIKAILNRDWKFSKEVLDSFKKFLSESFNPTKTWFETKFPLLKELAEKIKEKLS